MHIKRKKLVTCMATLITLLYISMVTAFATTYDCSAGSHNFQTTIMDPTETTEGSITYTCTLCGDSYSETIATQGHKWGWWITVQEATCTENGHEHRVCANNHSHIDERVIAATGTHSFIETIIEPTCDEAGKVVFTCSYCNYSYSEVGPK